MRNHTKLAGVWLAFLAGLSGAVQVHAGDAPVLGAPMFGIGPGAAQLALTNCGDTNFQYVVQISTNLTEWTSVTTNFATGPDLPVAVPAFSPSSFYRVVVIPHVSAPMFQWAMISISNINFNGHNGTVANATIDSFNSVDPLYSTAGNYDVSKRTVLICHSKIEASTSFIPPRSWNMSAL